MNYEYKQINDYKPIYEYCRKVGEAVPYWFEADYEQWLESFADDTDYDGEKMFREIITVGAFYEGRAVGFVQFGIPMYIYAENGEKDYFAECGIIRNFYFDKEHNCGKGLIYNAEKYFFGKKVSKQYAFFHAFGMTCNAGHGKLHCGLPYIEDILFKFGYEKEHENVYYKRLLTEKDVPSDKIAVNYGEITSKGLQEFTIEAEGRSVGAGALVYLPQGEICYLKWIYVCDTEQGKGYASAALQTIFADLYSKGISRLDTDTADGNVIAQKLYTKVGFADMGLTRSYLK